MMFPLVLDLAADKIPVAVTCRARFLHTSLVERSFTAPQLDQLWLTDITEHPTG